MKAAMPPAFCASAITCSAMVVFPEDSGPKTSLMRPRGKPPTPSAASSEIEPVRSEEHTSELQSLRHLVCRLLLEKKKTQQYNNLPRTRTRYPPSRRLHLTVS